MMSGFIVNVKYLFNSFLFLFMFFVCASQFSFIKGIRRVLKFQVDIRLSAVSMTNELRAVVKAADRYLVPL